MGLKKRNEAELSENQRDMKNQRHELVAILENFLECVEEILVVFGDIALVHGIARLAVDARSSVNRSSPPRKDLFYALKEIFKNRNQLMALVFMFSLIFGQFSLIPFLSHRLFANGGLPESSLPSSI